MTIPATMWLGLSIALVLAVVLIIIGVVLLRRSRTIPAGYELVDAEIVGWIDDDGNWLRIGVYRGDDEGDDEDDDTAAGEAAEDESGDAPYDDSDDVIERDEDGDDLLMAYPVLRWQDDDEVEREETSSEAIAVRRHGIGAELTCMYDPDDPSTIQPLDLRVSAASPGAVMLMVGLGIGSIALAAALVVVVIQLASR